MKAHVVVIKKNLLSLSGAWSNSGKSSFKENSPILTKLAELIRVMYQSDWKSYPDRK